jgi:transposase
LWNQFRALLPRSDDTFDPAHPLGCHRRRIPHRIIIDKLLAVLVFGCSYVKIADTTCSATTLRRRRDEWIAAGVFAMLERLVRDSYDRMIGLDLRDIAVDGCITKAPGGGQVAGRSPVDRGKQGMKRSAAADGRGIPLGAVTAAANRHDSPLLGPTLDVLDALGPLPDDITVHLDRGYDSTVTRQELADRQLTGRIAEKGKPAPIQAGQRWVVERTHAWVNAFNRLQRCYERRQPVVDAFISLAHAIVTLRRLIRIAWTNYRWNTRPAHRP